MKDATRSVGRWLFPALLLTGASAFAQPGDQSAVRSPVLTGDGDVVLRLRAPAAEQVQLTSGGDIAGLNPGVGKDLERNEDGVWQVTLPALDPGAFRYKFQVDGVPTLDPVNPLTSQSNGTAWSLFHVPGAAFMDTQAVPHGAVAEVHYFAETLGRHRRMHVYTPPGYELDSAEYPVFYLLHGAGDSDDSWSTVGRAGFILDNLIASGQARPMIVVMPHGHPPAADDTAGGMQIAGFAEEFAADIKPHVENHYRVSEARGETAIAGLSMGGAHTLQIAMADLESYGYVGVFSSGVFGIAESNEFEETHRATLDNAALRDGLDYFWFGIGSDDFLLEIARSTVDMFESHGFEVVYHESGGGHTWMNWRDYLNDFAQQLFE